MSIAYTNRIHDLKYIYNCIEQVSLQHPGFAHFDSGSDVELGKPDYSYPLLYLETIGQVTESIKSETYSIALNVCDRIPADPNHRQRVEGHSKVKQLFSEVLYPTIFFEPFVAIFRPLIISLWRSFLREEVLVESS